MKHRSPTEQIHIWRVPLSPPDNLLILPEGLLNPDEKERAARFHFDKDRRRYTIARGALRMILAGYLEERPEQLSFQLGRLGKPRLAGLPDQSGENRVADRRGVGESRAAMSSTALHFNLSHCLDLALIAVSAGRLVGVDVEKVRNVGTLDSIVDRYFSPGEKRYLTETSPVEYPIALLTLWSRREAAAKALGLNLSTALSALELPVYPRGGSAQLTQLADLETDTGEKRPAWFIRDLELDAGHVGALCSEGSQIPVVFRDFGD